MMKQIPVLKETDQIERARKDKMNACFGAAMNYSSFVLLLQR
jgi:hypothetical protein